MVQRKPSHDIFSLETSNEEFYFRMSYDTLDFLFYARENEVAIEDVYSLETQRRAGEECV
jgi:NH3-dependent NAD+ synthetase